jgi:16S rRNA G1207 methylase RsmC
MAYPSKFRDAYTTSVRIEKQARKLADILDIQLSDALKIGLNVMIKSEISNQNKKITPEFLKEFLEIEEYDLKDLQAYIHLKREQQSTLENIAEMQKEATKQDEIIEVWDDVAEAYIHIRQSEFNANFHQVRA